MLQYFIQDDESGAQEIANVSEEKTLSLMELLFQGGIAGSIIIAILLILLFIAIYLYFERSFAIKAASKEDVNFMNQIKEHIAGGNLEGATQLRSEEHTSELQSRG